MEPLNYRLYELVMQTPAGLLRTVRTRHITPEQATDTVCSHFPSWSLVQIRSWAGDGWQEPCPDCGRMIGHAPNCPRQR
jgi:hypothetical protein